MDAAGQQRIDQMGLQRKKQKKFNNIGHKTPYFLKTSCCPRYQGEPSVPRIHSATQMKTRTLRNAFEAITGGTSWRMLTKSYPSQMD